MPWEALSFQPFTLVHFIQQLSPVLGTGSDMETHLDTVLDHLLQIILLVTHMHSIVVSAIILGAKYRTVKHESLAYSTAIFSLNF